MATNTKTKKKKNKKKGRLLAKRDRIELAESSAIGSLDKGKALDSLTQDDLDINVEKDEPWVVQEARLRESNPELFAYEAKRAAVAKMEHIAKQKEKRKQFQITTTTTTAATGGPHPPAKFSQKELLNIWLEKTKYHLLDEEDFQKDSSYNNLEFVLSSFSFSLVSTENTPISLVKENLLTLGWDIYTNTRTAEEDYFLLALPGGGGGGGGGDHLQCIHFSYYGDIVRFVANDGDQHVSTQHQRLLVLGKGNNDAQTMDNNNGGNNSGSYDTKFDLLIFVMDQCCVHYCFIPKNCIVNSTLRGSGSSSEKRLATN